MVSRKLPPLASDTSRVDMNKHFGLTDNTVSEAGAKNVEKIRHFEEDTNSFVSAALPHPAVLSRERNDNNVASFLTTNLFTSVCGSKWTYHNLFEGDPSIIEREQPSCSLRLHSVITPFLDSSTELRTGFSTPDFYKAVSGGSKRTYHNLFEGDPSIIE